MGQAYMIFGRVMQPHVLALATIGSVAAGVTYASMGTKRVEPQQQAALLPLKQEREEEFDLEKLISDFIKEEGK
ncbi:Mco10p Ecym_5594 [Eremothecium cymbalariae DBVPG|uniref:ATP synthase subunit K, mitochondrial n=1 Tax=Eremothecium cymbalariae (strain CBS 270.75 / DBVPG 7215 / KCTC 17166 / NRRL Y-17582) TaxID=931890 RepID=I6NE39_ERECY|nr:hypothetical protein Ecym_5594 [Eremothecium cymbalariae DBVPG\